MALRKLPPGYRDQEGDSRKCLVLAAVPLTAIMLQQLHNHLCSVAIMSQEGEVRGLSAASVDGGEPQEDGSKCSISEEELLSGKFLILFVHPESLTSPKGQQFLRNLRRAKMGRGIVLDELHQGQKGHWEVIRPQMLEKVLSCQVYLVKGSPLAALTATATQEEVNTVIQCFGTRKKPPIMILEGPVMSHHKICVVKRPSSQTPLLGETKPRRGEKNQGWGSWGCSEGSAWTDWSRISRREGRSTSRKQWSSLGQRRI